MASAIDEDTVRTVQSGRETLGAMLSAAQTQLQKVFIVFIIGMFGTVLALQYGLWDRLRQDLLYSKMDLTTQQATNIVAVTPFDVILLQIKIGLIVGAMLAVPLVVFFGRDSLRQRGWWPAEHIPAWKGALFVLTALGLFAAGVAYAYELFFPLMFNFLAGNASAAGFSPQYSIVKWAQFVFLLAISFGLAAQLPLMMTTLSYTGIVPYETFREKWRYAVVGITIFGAVFSPPDPFTQILWAAPLCILYGLSLAITRLVVTIQRSNELVSTRGVAREHWNIILGSGVLSGGLVYFVLTSSLFSYVQAAEALAADYSSRLTGNLARPAMFGLSTTETAVLLGVFVGLLGTVAALYYYVVQTLDESIAAEGRTFGDPTDLDVGELTAAAVRDAAPPELFAEMSEEEALGHADTALSDENQEKAQAILDRWDAIHEDDEASAEAAADEAPDDGGNVFTSTTAGMADAFTEEETTEDDIGGYYYDIRFILDSLLSKAFWILGVFGVVLSAVFLFLYQGGIGTIQRTFVSRLPEGMQAGVSIVTLHPVEHLIFIVKFSTIVGAVSAVPLVAYFAWPALRERGLVIGDRKILLVWGGSLFAALIVGSLVGFLYVAPVTISAIAQDQLQANMVIAYRISNFGWLVFFLTVGIGLLAEIPVTMFLFHRGGIVPFTLMYERWREVVVGILILSAVLSPSGIFTMFLVGIPTALAYLFGLGILWVYTLGGRRTTERRGEPAD